MSNTNPTDPSLPLAVEVVGLKKSYGYHRVLTGLDFTLQAGCYLVVAGRNGCGKTTLIDILATLLRPSAGKVLINGLDIYQKASVVRSRLGYVGHASLLYPALTVRENLLFYGRMYAVGGLENRIAELIDRLELSRWQDRKVSELSRGTQQRASLARGVIHQPALLLLDEPESGLDPAALAGLENLLNKYKAGGGSILAASHNLEFALKNADRIAILANGRFKLEAAAGQFSLSELKTLVMGDSINHDRKFDMGGGAP